MFTLNRRIFLNLIGLSAVAATLPQSVLSETINTDSPEALGYFNRIEHPIFSSVKISDANLTKFEFPYFENITDKDIFEKLLKQGIDLDAEILAIAKQETIFQIEEKWIASKSQNIVHSYVFDSFLNLDNELNDKILEIANDKNSNTVIVSPTALTIIQATVSADNFCSSDKSKSISRNSLRYAGKLHNKIDVLVWSYGNDKFPVLIGYVNPIMEKRVASLIQTDFKEYEFGESNYPDVWSAISVDSEPYSKII